MLNQDSLSRLKDLKDKMESEKERADAVVKGTQSRYGFAILEDGREIFIPPDEMLKVFPDDRVKVCIRPDKGNRLTAEIEKLIDCPIGEFTGRCVRKGKAVFVEPDLARLKRWLFIPPQARNGVREGDYVRSAVLRHPVKDGRPQAKILEILGNDDTAGIANLYAQAKYNVPTTWSEEALAQADRQIQSINPQQEQRRRDLTDREFISIDAVRTQDIDDALYAESSNEGWHLYVAIADPTTYIKAGSALEMEIAGRGTSAYFHGDAIPMMPEVLSQETCALAEDQIRPALVCKIDVSDAGVVGNFEFIEAVVRSRAKLSYVAVDRYLAGNYDELMSHATPLEALYQVYRALRANREAAELVMEDRTEFRWIMNGQKRIDHIEPQEKLLSQKLVEECMVAANRCGARFLQEHNCTGPFIGHSGFRTDLRKETKKFLTRFLPEHIDTDLSVVENYRTIMRALVERSGRVPLRAMVNRLLARAEISTKAQAHMGMALPCYSHCTSPLRKYTDYLSHRQIKKALHEEPADQLNPEQLQELAAHIQRARDASASAEQWLKCDYLQDKIGTEYQAIISHMTSSGFNVRLTENGIEGPVDLRKDPEKFSFDRWTAQLSSPTRQFSLQSEIRVKLVKADLHKREILFAPVATESAQDPVREAKTL